MILKKYLIILSFLTFSLYHSLKSQDAVFSQFYANKLYLNPAFTGFHLGTAANMNFRSQWANVRRGYSKFETRSVGISTNLPCYHSGFGLLYTDNTQGEGYLKWQNVAGSYAFTYDNDNDPNNSYQLSAGFRVGYNWRSVNWSNFVFSDQLDPLQGIIGASQYTPPANAISESKPYWDLDAGMVYFQEKIEWNNNLIAKEFRAGFAVNHLIKNNMSLLGYNEYLTKRWTGHVSWLHPLNRARSEEGRVYLNPMVRMDLQKASKNLAASMFMSWSYGIGVSTYNLYGGAYIQNQRFVPQIYNTNTITALLGYGWDAGPDLFVRFGISKDFNISGFTNYGGGAWEASLIVNPKQSMFCNPDSKAYKRRMLNQCKY